MSGPKVRRTMEWDPALYAAIQAQATAQGVSLAAMVERMVRDWIAAAARPEPSRGTPPAGVPGRSPT